MPDASIEEVINALTREIATAKEQASRLGYFQALYRRVTVEVAKGIEAGAFEDGARMERFDVRFAKRYLDELERHRRGEPTTRSWRVCFGAAQDERATTLQHMLLGINAHINLDLGIAAARTAPGTSLQQLKPDFDAINSLLVSLVDETQRKLSRVWPLMRPLDWLAGRHEERLVGFSMEIARDHAWRFAESLAMQSREEQDELIGRVDHWIAAFGERLHRPTWPLTLVQRGIRVCERGSVPQIIDWLS